MPLFPTVQRTEPVDISIYSPYAMAPAFKAMAAAIGTTTWPTANKAFFMPVPINQEVTIVKLFWQNGTVSGNIDVGIFDPYGAKLAGVGPVIQSGTNLVQSVDIPPITLVPGLYYFGMAMDNTTGSVTAAGFSAGICQAIGIFNQNTAYPLPVTGTYAAANGAQILPFLGASQRAQV